MSEEAGFWVFAFLSGIVGAACGTALALFICGVI
jgi:hypothetical protein